MRRVPCHDHLILICEAYAIDHRVCLESPGGSSRGCILSSLPAVASLLRAIMTIPRCEGVRLTVEEETGPVCQARYERAARDLQGFRGGVNALDVPGYVTEGAMGSVVVGLLLDRSRKSIRGTIETLPSRIHGSGPGLESPCAELLSPPVSWLRRSGLVGEQLRYWRAKAARLVVERDGFLLGPGVAIDKPVGELSEQQRKGLFLHLLCHKMDSQVGQLFRKDDVFYFLWKDVVDNNEKAAKRKPGSCFRYEPVTLKWAISLFIKLGKWSMRWSVKSSVFLPPPISSRWWWTAPDRSME